MNGHERGDHGRYCEHVYEHDGDGRGHDGDDRHESELQLYLRDDDHDHGDHDAHAYDHVLHLHGDDDGVPRHAHLSHYPLLTLDALVESVKLANPHNLDVNLKQRLPKASMI